jgi:hypothetical protein
VALAAMSFLAACSSDDDGDDGDAADETTTTAAEEETTTTTEAALDEAAATAEIETNLVAFFAALGAGDLDAAIPLLQNGEDYRSRMEHCRELTLTAAAEPQTVVFDDAETATVTFSILLGGAVVLDEAGGGAVLVDGTWLISENTFLSLYDAAKEGCTGPVPEDV